MANVIGSGIARTLVDVDGDPINVTGTALDINIVSDARSGSSDVDIHLDGGVPLLGNAGAVAAGVLRVTLASDDVHFGAIGGAADVDGTIHGQLRYIGNSQLAAGHTIDCNDSDVNVTNMISGFATSSAQLANNHNVVVTSAPTTAVTGTFWQTTQPVSGTVTANLSSTDNTVLDNILTKNTEIDAVLDTIKVDTEAIETAVEAIQVDADAIETLLTAANVDHAANEVLLTAIDSDTNDIKTAVAIPTGMVSGVNNAVSTSVEDLVGSGSVAIKRIDLMADPSNTGYIWVGDASVVNDGTGGGIRLGAGDFYSMDIDNLNEVHVAATVADEDIMYTYYA